MHLETCPGTDEQLYSAFTFCFVCGDLERFVDSGIKYVRWWLFFTVLFDESWSPWTSREIIFQKMSRWWQIMWWTPGTEINYSLKQLGHLLFLMEPGPHLGLEIVVMYVPQAENSSILCYKMNSWAEGRYESLIILNLREFVFAPASLFIIYYRRPKN